MTVAIEKIELLSERQNKLTDLTSHPGWAELKKIVEARKTAFEKTLAATWMSSNPSAQAVDQRQIDYWRGFYACADWLIANPENAEKTLKTALRGANLLKE